jgi:hypothetical protein
MIFLIEYDREHGKLLDLQSFSSADRKFAQHERLRRELELAGHEPSREVVLLEAEDKRALERTHRRYFCKTAKELAERTIDEYRPE